MSLELTGDPNSLLIPGSDYQGDLDSEVDKLRRKLEPQVNTALPGTNNGSEPPEQTTSAQQNPRPIGSNFDVTSGGLGISVVTKPTTLVLPDENSPVPVRTAVKSNSYNPAESVRFAANPLKYIETSLKALPLTHAETALLSLLTESTVVEQQLPFLKNAFEPKINRRIFYNKTTGQRETLQENAPSDYESLCLKVFAVLKTVIEIPGKTQAMAEPLNRLYRLGLHYLKITSEGFEFKGGRLYQQTLDLLVTSTLSAESRKALYNLTDLFESDSSSRGSLLLQMDKNVDLQHPFAARLFLEMITTNKDSPATKDFYTQQVRRASLLKQVFQGASHEDLAQLNFIQGLQKLQDGIIFDIENVERLTGRRIGLEVEYFPSNVFDHLIPHGFNENVITHAEGANEIRLNEDAIQYGWEQLTRIDALRRFLRAKSKGNINTAHMHLDRSDFSSPNLMFFTHIRNNNLGTHEIRGVHPIIVGDESISTVIIYTHFISLMESSGDSSVSSTYKVKQTNVPDNDQYLLWMFLNKFGYLDNSNAISPGIYFSRGNSQEMILGRKKLWKEQMIDLLKNDCFETIPQRLEDKNAEVRKQAVSVLERALYYVEMREWAFKLLLTKLEDVSSEVREQAIKSMERAFDSKDLRKQAFFTIFDKIKDSDYTVFHQAIYSTERALDVKELREIAFLRISEELSTFDSDRTPQLVQCLERALFYVELRERAFKRILAKKGTWVRELKSRQIMATIGAMNYEELRERAFKEILQRLGRGDYSEKSEALSGAIRALDFKELRERAFKEILQRLGNGDDYSEKSEALRGVIRALDYKELREMAYDAIQHTIQNEDDSDIDAEAVKGLAKALVIDEFREKTMGALYQILRSGKLRSRIQAVEGMKTALGIAELKDRAFDAIIQAIGDSELRDDDWEVRERAIKAMQLAMRNDEWGEKAFDVILHTLKIEKISNVRKQVARSMENAFEREEWRERACDAILQLIDEKEDYYVRKQALQSMAKALEVKRLRQRVVDMLLILIDDKTWVIRQQAVGNLNIILNDNEFTRKVFAEIFRKLSDDDDDVRLQALQGMEKVLDREDLREKAIDGILSRIADDNGTVASSACEALESAMKNIPLREMVYDAVFRAVRSENKDLRRQAIYLMGKALPITELRERAFSIISEALDDRDWHISEAANDAMREARKIEELRERAEDILNTQLTRDMWS